MPSTSMKDAAAARCLRRCVRGGMPGNVAHTGHTSARAKTARNGGDNDQAPATNRDECRPDRVHNTPVTRHQRRPNDSPC
eukprot:5034922-Lingulodinium_polyedra.AAC.1